MTVLKSLLASIVLFGAFAAHADFNDYDRYGRHDDRRGGWDRHDDRRGGWGRDDRRGPPGWGRDDRRGPPGRGDWGRGGYGSSACQDALANLQYTQSELAKYTALIQQSNQICGANPFCRQQQVQAWQYAANQVQQAEQRRQQACN